MFVPRGGGRLRDEGEGERGKGRDAKVSLVTGPAAGERRELGLERPLIRERRRRAGKENVESGEGARKPRDRGKKKSPGEQREGGRERNCLAFSRRLRRGYRWMSRGALCRQSGGKAPASRRANRRLSGRRLSPRFGRRCKTFPAVWLAGFGEKRGAWSAERTSLHVVG